VAVLAGCALYAIDYLWRRYMKPAETMSGVPSIAE